MTANVMQEDVQEYFNIGMNAYVAKPFNADELLLKTHKVMGNNRPVSRAPAPEPQPAKKKYSPPARYSHRPHFPQAVHRRQRRKTTEIHRHVPRHNAPKLLENIDKALVIKDYQTIKIAAHSLKPQLSYMGVKEDVSNIFLIEQSAGEKAHYESLPELITNLKRICSKAFEELRA